MSKFFPKHILVLGGLGYLGLHLTHFFSRDHHVSIIDQVPLEYVSQDAYLRALCQASRVSYWQANLTQPLSLPMGLAKADTLFYSASVQDVSYLRASLDWAYMHGVRQIILFSSAAVYGQQLCPVSESVVTTALSDYGQLKQNEEQILKKWAQQHDIQCTVLRIFNVYGCLLPSLVKSGTSSMLPEHLLSLAKTSRAPMFRVSPHSSLDQSFMRDYIHVADVLLSCAQAVKRTDQLKLYEVFNVGTGKATSLNTLIEQVEFITGIHFRRVIDAAPADEVSWSVAQVDSIRETLSWQAHMSLQAGLSGHYEKYYV